MRILIVLLQLFLKLILYLFHCYCFLRFLVRGEIWSKLFSIGKTIFKYFPIVILFEKPLYSIEDKRSPYPPQVNALIELEHGRAMRVWVEREGGDESEGEKAWELVVSREATVHQLKQSLRHHVALLLVSRTRLCWW